MLVQSGEGETVPANPAQWLNSVTKREPSREEFVIDSGAATSVNEFTGNRIGFACAGGVKVLMGLEQDTANAAEAQPARPGNVPVLPSEAEVEQHELTHLPFRKLCRDCVRAKGKESPHHESSPGGVSKFRQRLYVHG